MQNLIVAYKFNSYTFLIWFFAVSVHAENDRPQLRGVLIQSRIVADDTTLVGTFAVNADSSTTTRLSDCSPSNVSINFVHSIAP